MQTKNPKKNSLAAGAWIALIVGSILLVLLLTFILQNQERVTVELFTLQASLPLGVGFLLSALGGAIITALISAWRMMDMRRQLKR